MSQLVRFGVSMDKELVQMLDEYTHTYHFPNRSHTIRHMIHEHLSEIEHENDESEVTSVISLIFKAGTTLERVSIAPYPSIHILTNLQSHIKENIVLKILVVHGTSKEIRKWSFEVMKSPHVVGKISIVAPDTMVEELTW
jgi:CopG family nickel-responsive transcriptional regulator